MARMIFIRLLQMPVILAVIFMITFWLAWILPGDPLERPEGQRPPEEVQWAMKKQYNLDSKWSFLKSYMAGLAKGDLGPSLNYRDQRVNDIVKSGLPVSVLLGIAALWFALHLGLLAGIVGTLRAGSIWDMGGLAVALVGVSLPTFVTGAILLILFAGIVEIFPPGGWGSPKHLILPALALGLAPAAYIARLVRLGLADVMNSDFIRTARAKGLSYKDALFKHALKVAFLPVLSFLGPAAAATFTGSFVIETIFAIPGLGDHFVNAVLNKDQFLILGLVLVYSSMLVLFNLLVDIAYAFVDPRIDLS